MNKKDLIIKKNRKNVKGLTKIKIFDYITLRTWEIEEAANDYYNEDHNYTFLENYEMYLDHFVDLLNGENVKINLDWLKLTKEDVI